MVIVGLSRKALRKCIAKEEFQPMAEWQEMFTKRLDQSG